MSEKESNADRKADDARYVKKKPSGTNRPAQDRTAENRQMARMGY